MRTNYYLKSILLLLLLAGLYTGQVTKAQLIYGASPFQDSMWAVDTSSWSVVQRTAPTLPGFTINGINGMAWDPVYHETYVIMKVSGVSGRVLGKIDLATGVCTQVGNLGDNFSSIAFRKDGQLFGVKGDGASTNAETMFIINKNTGTNAIAVALGNGADGEVIAYNQDDNMFYHWSGNGTVVYEKFPATAPYTPVTGIPTSGSVGGETFGALYLGSNKFIISNISSNLKYLSTTGAYGNNLHTNPDDLRGLVMPPRFAFSDDTVCVGETVTWDFKGVALDSVVYDWGDGTTTTVFPVGGASHVYASAGNYTTYAILKNDTVGLDSMTSAPIRVNALPLVALTPGADTIMCLTDSLNLVGSSGGSSQWYMNGQPIVGATTHQYTVTVNGWYNMVKANLNGCQDSAATGIAVWFGNEPVVDLGSDDTLCDGDTLCITLTNPNDVTYLWSTGSTGATECFLVPGIYGVTATDSVGCAAMDDIVVTVIQAPAPSITADTSGCPTVVFAHNDPNGTAWTWAFGDGGTSTSPNPSHTYASNGTYSVTVVGTNTCFADSAVLSLNIDCIVGISNGLRNVLSIAPNPSNGSFTLMADLPAPATLRCTVTDLSGRTLLDQSQSDMRSHWEERIDLKAAPGIYLLRVETGTDHAVYQIVVQ